MIESRGRRLECSSKQIHAKLNQAPRKTHFDDHVWIQHNREKIPSIDRRSTALNPRQQEVPMHRQPIMTNQPSRNLQARTYDC